MHAAELYKGDKLMEHVGAVFVISHCGSVVFATLASMDTMINSMTAEM